MTILTAEAMYAEVARAVEEGDSPVALAVRTYRRAVADPNGTLDPRLLDVADAELRARLQTIGDGPLPFDLIRVSIEAGYWRGDREGVLALLFRYLRQPLATDEEAWARWHAVDHLALLRRCAESVATMEDLVRWAEPRFPPGGYLWAVNDGTQALCWREVGRADDWLKLADRLSYPATAENRLDRLSALRTAGMLLARLGRTDEAAWIPDRMRSLAAEDPSWVVTNRTRAEATALELNVLQSVGDIRAIRAVGAAAARELLGQERGPGSSIDLATRCHNTAAPLYRARQYDLSIPLFRQAVAFGTSSPHAYLWLAASIWASGGHRSEVEEVLRGAANRISGGDAWAAAQALPEFRDATDDAGFAAAACGTVAGRTTAITSVC